MKRSKLKTIVLVVVMVLGIVYICIMAPQSYALSLVKSKTVDYTKNIDIQHGDFIFQHLPGPLPEMIVDVEQGQYSHCGIIIKEGGKWYVLEAIGPVKKTPIDAWISHGIKDQFTIVRLKEAHQKDIPKIISAAKKFLGRPYDIQYEWDDRKIYCSELIAKAVLNGAGIQLAEFERLGDMKWQPYEDEIRYLDGGNLPLDREMITPDAVALSDKVHTIFSSFPVNQKNNAQYNMNDLAGAWKGKYTLADLVLSLDTQVNESGEIEQGNLKSGLFFDHIAIKNFNEKTGTFSYVVQSNNDIRIEIAGRLDHGRDAIYGQWKDSLGYSGMFHMKRQ